MAALEIMLLAFVLIFLVLVLVRMDRNLIENKKSDEVKGSKRQS